MPNMRACSRLRWVTCLLVWLTLCGAAAARERPFSVDASYGAGLGYTDTQGLGMRVDLRLIGSAHFLRLGGQLGAQGWFGSVSHLAPSVLAGVGFGPGDLDLRLLAQYGSGEYSGWGRDGLSLFGSSDPGADATIPFYGALLQGALRLGDSRHPHGLLYLSVGYERDLGSQTVSYAWEYEGLFGSSTSREENTRVVGDSYRVMFSAGAALGWD